MSGEYIPKNEIEVTPEMIDAGLCALVSTAGYFDTDVPRREIVSAVIAAALIVANRHSQQEN